jgi:hypothetical protein
MAGVTVTVPAKTWVALTGKQGSIFHKAGGKVIYVEAPTTPTFDASTPVVFTTEFGEKPQAFNSIAASDNLYAYALNNEAVIAVSPAEGV